MSCDSGSGSTGGSGPVSVTGVSLDKTTATLKVGETLKLKATIVPVDATNQKVTWSSSDIEVATVTDGLVTAIKEGTADITVTTEDGKITATCKITVEAASSTGLTIEQVEASLVGFSWEEGEETITIGDETYTKDDYNRFVEDFADEIDIVESVINEAIENATDLDEDDEDAVFTYTMDYLTTNYPNIAKLWEAMSEVFPDSGEGDDGEDNPPDLPVEPTDLLITNTAALEAGTYYVGDSISISDLQLQFVMSDESEGEIDQSKLSISGNEFETSGAVTVTVTYGTLTAELHITVLENKVESITVTSPTKTEYVKDETFSIDGVTVTATYSNGDEFNDIDGWTWELVPSGETTGSQAFVAEKYGTYTLKVSYEGKEKTFSIQYTETALVATSISIDYSKVKTEFFAGEKFNHDNLVVTATYDDDSTATVTPSSVTLQGGEIPLTVETETTLTVTVTYKELEAQTYNITVKPVVCEKIEVTTGTGFVSEYNKGDTLKTTGITIKATYNNGNVEYPDENVTFTPTTLSTAGEQTITVTYKNKTDTFTVTVKEPLGITVTISQNDDIDITVNDKTLTVGPKEGSSLNLEGATYAWKLNGKTVSETDSYTANPKTGEVQVITVIVTVGEKKYSANATVKGN